MSRRIVIITASSVLLVVLYLLSSPGVTMKTQTSALFKDVSTANKQYGHNINKYINVHDFQPPLFGEDIRCIVNKIASNLQIPCWICIHNPDRDLVSKGVFEATFEPSLHREIFHQLAISEKCGLLDIGTNIGVNSIDFATSGRYVVAVEPQYVNIVALHNSVRLNKVENRYILLHNAVSNERGCVELSSPGQKENRGKYYVSGHITCEIGSVRAILLDDLVDLIPFNEAVIKIDIEGSEAKAFAKASKLFDTINVTSVFMEMAQLTKDVKNARKGSSSFDEVQGMMNFFRDRGYMPYVFGTPCGLDFSRWTDWPENVLWIHASIFSWYTTITPKRSCDTVSGSRF